MTIHLLDTNVLIEAKGSHYGFPSCQDFLEWLRYMNGIGRVYSIGQVRREIRGYGLPDEISEWTKNNKSMFLNLKDDNIASNTASVIKWARDIGYQENAVHDFANCADSHLVGYAKTMGATVVTEEKGGSGNRALVKIPDACRAFRLKCVTGRKFVEIASKKFALEDFKRGDSGLSVQGKLFQ